jgi:hypothetical protein
MDPHVSHLPAYLAPQPDRNVGLGVIQKIATALSSLVRQGANPASLDYIPVAGSIEDHATMAVQGVAKADRCVDAALDLFAIELIVAAGTCGTQPGWGPVRRPCGGDPRAGSPDDLGPPCRQRHRDCPCPAGRRLDPSRRRQRDLDAARRNRPCRPSSEASRPTRHVAWRAGGHSRARSPKARGGIRPRRRRAEVASPSVPKRCQPQEAQPPTRLPATTAASIPEVHQSLTISNEGGRTDRVVSTSVRSLGRLSAASARGGVEQLVGNRRAGGLQARDCERRGGSGSRALRRAARPRFRTRHATPVADLCSDGRQHSDNADEYANEH